MVFTNLKNSHSEFASLPLYSKVLHNIVTNFNFTEILLTTGTHSFS